MANLVSAKTKGWTVIKNGTNLPETLAALNSLKSKAYVTGEGDLIDGNGPHTVNIIGLQGEDGCLKYRGTSDYDVVAGVPRKYSLGSASVENQVTQITGLTFAIPTSEVSAYNKALSEEIEMTKEAQAQAQQ